MTAREGRGESVARDIVSGAAALWTTAPEAGLGPGRERVQTPGRPCASAATADRKAASPESSSTSSTRPRTMDPSVLDMVHYVRFLFFVHQFVPRPVDNSVDS